MGKKRIPQDVREEVDEIVGRFNLKVIKDPDYFYVTRYRGIGWATMYSQASKVSVHQRHRKLYIRHKNILACCQTSWVT